MHPNRKRLISGSLIGLLAAVAVAGCSTTETGRMQLTTKSERQLEIDAKRQFEVMRENMPLVQDPATVEYVACVANALVEVMEGDAAEMYWEMAIFNQPTVNAMVMPGGKISVFAGILDVAQNQHQLASVLGHEMAHATSKHANERASRGAVTGTAIDITAAILGAPSDPIYTRSQYERAAQRAYGIQGAFDALEDLGINRPFSRMQESEADEIGMLYMARAGFDPRESVQLWKNMSAQSETKVAEMLSTHPSDETRLQAHIDQLTEALIIYNQAQAEGHNPQCER